MSERVPERQRLALGADVVQRLLPHRRPFLFVDGIDWIVLGARPALGARKLVSANEPVFDGHFPGFSLWPGVYTIEGLGQTANLLTVLTSLAEGAAREGVTSEALFDALRGLDGSRRGPRTSAPHEERITRALGDPRSRIGYAGAVDVKLVEPVFAGSVIEYRVALTHVLANARRHEVEATVEGRPVARGTLTSAVP
jgi:3-hydroxyacyl-[acyl-carrier-protein] dehydratase